MPQIQRPDLVEKVRKRYEITGPDAIQTISPELVPVVIMDDASSEESTKIRGLATHSATSAVGEYPHINLYLPNIADNANKVLHIQEIHFSSNANTLYYLVDSNGDLGTAGSYVISDTRFRPQTTPAARCTYASQAVGTGTIYGYHYANSGVRLALVTDLWVAPGYGWGIRGNVTNKRLDVNFRFTEYVV